MFESRCDGSGFDEPAKLRTRDHGGNKCVDTKHVGRGLQRGGRSYFSLDHGDQLKGQRGVEQLLRRRPTRRVRAFPCRANAKSWDQLRKDRRVGSALRTDTGSGPDGQISIDLAVQRCCWKPRDGFPTYGDGFTPMDHRHTGRRRSTILLARGCSSLHSAHRSGDIHMVRASLFQRNGARANGGLIGKYCNRHLRRQVDGSGARDRNRQPELLPPMPSSESPVRANGICRALISLD